MSTTPFLDLAVENARRSPLTDWCGVGWYVRDPLNPADRPFARRVVVRAKTHAEASEATWDALDFADFGQFVLLNWYTRPLHAQDGED